jgi:lipoprotein-anchoring transpeptidase ErfK/SrfK
VAVTAALTGVEASKGVWGTSSEIGKFEIGRSMVSLVNLKTHTMKVYQDGKLLRTIPVTGGKPGFTSRSGIKVVLGKVYYKVMDGTSIGIPKDSPDYYRLDVYYAVQVTRSGEFVHAAPWSTWAQGETNVSHGCIGMNTANGRWFYDRSIVGDIITTTGTTKPMELNNGFGDWNLSWSDWVKGSALVNSAATDASGNHAAASYSRSGP